MTAPAPATGSEAGGLSKKGLSAGTIGLIGAVVIGISCIAPAYTFTAAIGPTVGAVGVQVPAIILVGFIPMLLVAFGYRELNNRMPDSGTSFTWAARAFGPWVGWMAGWGLIAATIIVLSNLAGIAVDFLFLLISQLTGQAGIADLASNLGINIVVCLLFVLGATVVSYRDMQTTQKLQYVLVTFQVLVLVVFAIVAITHAVQGDAFEATPFSWEWFNPFAVSSPARQSGAARILRRLSCSPSPSTMLAAQSCSSSLGQLASSTPRIWKLARRVRSIWPFP